MKLLWLKVSAKWVNVIECLSCPLRSSSATLELVLTRRLRLQWPRTKRWKRQEPLCPGALMSWAMSSSMWITNTLFVHLIKAASCGFHNHMFVYPADPCMIIWWPRVWLCRLKSCRPLQCRWITPGLVWVWTPCVWKNSLVARVWLVPKHHLHVFFVCRSWVWSVSQHPSWPVSVMKEDRNSFTPACPSLRSLNLR